MKNVFLILFFSLILSACSVGDAEKSEFEVLPILDVDMPAVGSISQATEIKIYYRRPTDCHVFNRVLYRVDQYTRTVAIESVKLNESNCSVDNVTEFEIPIPFNPSEAGIYTFKFWIGTDQNNVNQYLVKEIEVF
jgi:PBP1b-binding outer membrane lipoprotein LpoB